MQTVIKLLFFFTLFYAITTEKVKYSLIYESGSWCDYWTDLGLVNIQVRQDKLAKEKMSNFSMMLHDEYDNQYRANCTVLPQYEEDGNSNVKPTDAKNSNAPSYHDEDTDNMNEDEDKNELYEDQTEDEKIPDKEIETDEAGSNIPKKNSDIKGTEKANDETDKEDLDEIKDTRENLDEDEIEKEGEGKKGNSDEYSFENEDKDVVDDREYENGFVIDDDGQDEDKDVVDDREYENGFVIDDDGQDEEQKNTENIRNLEEYVQAQHAFCYFDPPKIHTNLYYVENTLELPEDAKFEVEVMDNFFIMAQACPNAKDAEKKYNVNLSFRQLNHFKNENGKISFNFYGLTTQDLGIEFTIIIQIHLIGMNKKPLQKEVECKIQSAVTLGDNDQAQAEFLCEIEDAGIEYTELELSYSESIAGIPYDDETLLNPKKTDDAINNPDSELFGIDYSDENYGNFYPLMFSISAINSSQAADEGIFTLQAKFARATDEEYEFTIPLTYPKGNAICSIPITEANTLADIICILDGQVHNQKIIFEQRILTFKYRELFTMSKFESTEPFTSKNGVEFKMEKKRNLKLSFKQLNTFSFDSTETKITFNFFGLTTNSINAGDNLIKLFVFLISDGNKFSQKVPASCSLKEGIEMGSKRQALAKFECVIYELVVGRTYSSFELVSSDDLAGIPDDETLLDIAKTDTAIQNGDLTIPSEEDNLPPLFIPSAIDGEKCYLDGEFIITGELYGNTDISEFDLPLSYPTDHTAKCKVESTQVKCTMIEDFVNHKIIIEQQSIREGFIELMTIEGLTSEKEFSCIQGNFTEPSGEGEKTNEAEGEKTNEPEKEKTNEAEGEKTNEPEKEKTNEPEREKTNEPEREKTNEPEREKTNEPEKEKTNEAEGEKTNEPEKEKTNEPERASTIISTNKLSEIYKKEKKKKKDKHFNKTNLSKNKKN